MKNKGIIQFFAIVLALACLHQLSFTFFAKRFEQQAEVYAQHQIDSLKNLGEADFEGSLSYWKDIYLKENGHQVAYPIFGFSYLECKDKEINLGLDLQGGMSVSLEVSMSDLLKQLAGQKDHPHFVNTLKKTELEIGRNNKDFITLFAENWQKEYPSEKLVEMFYHYNQKEKFPLTLTNEEVVAVLRQEAVRALDGTEQVLRSRIDQFGVAQPVLQKQAVTNRIHVELPGVKDKQRVRKLLQATANLEFYEALDSRELANNLGQLDQALSVQLYGNYRDSLDQAFRNPAVKETAKKETSTTQEQQLEEGAIDDLNLAQENSIDQEDFLAQVDQQKYAPLLSRLGVNQQGPVVGYAKIADTAKINSLLQSNLSKQFLPRNVEWMWDAKVMNSHQKESSYIALYAISKEKNQPLIDGKTIVEASVSLDPISGKPAVSMNMDSNGRRIWKDVTTRKLNKFVAITLDNRVLSAPVISSVIADGRSQISGSFSYAEAQDLVSVLRAGALPVPAKIMAENYVGPSLGAENIESSLISFLVAIALVLVYMIFYYGKAGLITNFALLFNLFFLVGFLVTLQATLNLPSIAGLILTIGMAVDANVLIFERIREELKKTKDLAQAIAQGYKNAIWSILDANITTALIGIILLMFGMGAVKGFAITLLIGIGTSFFTGVFLTRLFFEKMLSSKQNITFSAPWSQNLFNNIYVDFVKSRKIFYGVSLIFIVIGIFGFFTKGINYGIDFSGGRKFKISFEEPVSENAIRNALSNLSDEQGKNFSAEVKKVEDDQHFFITTKYLIDDVSAESDAKVEKKLMEGLSKLLSLDRIHIDSMFLVDSTISEEMKTSSWVSVIGALIIIFLYIAFRFRKWQYGLGALLALAHDVCIVLAVFVWAEGFLPFSLEMDQNLIAALLTVVGYSINDTVVVFDRLREFKVFDQKKIDEKLLNQALSSTISRTLNTSLTTLLVLLVILIFGGESIKGFVFAMTVGVFVGTYSSLFIAAPAVLDSSKK